jgi:hypothetical protein
MPSTKAGTRAAVTIAILVVIGASGFLLFSSPEPPAVTVAPQGSQAAADEEATPNRPPRFNRAQSGEDEPRADGKAATADPTQAKADRKRIGPTNQPTGAMP